MGNHRRWIVSEPTAAVGLRYRIATLQDGREHVSTVVLNEAEALESLDMEAHLHEAFGGWTVDRITGAGGYLVAVRATNTAGVRRYVYARSFSPMHDTPKEGPS